MTLNEIEKLKEINRMATRSADRIAESMSVMFGLDVAMSISSVNMVSVANISKFVGITEESTVVGSYIAFNGDLNGSVVCVLSIKCARDIAQILLAGMEEENRDPLAVLTEMEQSSIMELGNIITSSFIDVWANSLSVVVNQEPPAFSCDYLSNILETSMGGSVAQGDFAFMFDSLMNVTNHDIDFEVLVLPDLDSMQIIFDNIPSEGVIINE
ncbi:MAG: chemotaxis protein CheC [Halobacteriota archaeon]|nr:chemotaxis protein CheC [Halobacteriota archaeon]MDY6958065.1 chemotaxis protein CheC [Halobacteriota archaeon]